MLLRTRYEKQSVVSSEDDLERVIRMDATTFEFSALNACGETWYPEEALSPTLLVELGWCLIKHCKAPEGERPAAIKQIEEKATELERYLSAHPQT
jgi:hypothetical protein